MAPVRAASSERLARILTRLALREQINCEQYEQKIRNKHRCRAPAFAFTSQREHDVLFWRRTNAFNIQKLSDNR